MERKEIAIKRSMKLAECEWFGGVYRRIYDILAIGGRLPPPSEIGVALEVEGEVPEEARGFALKDAGVVWFRHIPPTPDDFAHELIHLAEKKRDGEWEEVYGYNLSQLVALLAERGIVPRRNPLVLFEEVTLDDLLEAIRKVYRYEFETIEEYFEFKGVVPSYCYFEPVATEDRLAVKRKPSVPDEVVLAASIAEIAAGALFDPLDLAVILELLGVERS